MPDGLCNKINALSFLDQTVFDLGPGGFFPGPIISGRHCAPGVVTCPVSCDDCHTPFVDSTETHTRYPQFAIVQVHGDTHWEGQPSLTEPPVEAPDCGTCDCYPRYKNFVLPLYESGAAVIGQPSLGPGGKWVMFSTLTSAPRSYNALDVSSRCFGEDIELPVCEYQVPVATLDPENPWDGCEAGGQATDAGSPNLIVAISGSDVVYLLGIEYIGVTGVLSGASIASLSGSSCSSGQGIILPNSFETDEFESDYAREFGSCVGTLSATVTFSNWITRPFPT